MRLGLDDSHLFRIKTNCFEPMVGNLRVRQLLIVMLKVRVLSGSLTQNEPLSISVERFLSELRFDSREKAQVLIENLGN